MSIVVGYHGTSSDRLGSINSSGFTLTKRTASWLGFGAYFFFNAPEHASNWARSATARRQVNAGISAKPVLLEAEINLGNCLNLLDCTHWPIVKAAYANVSASISQVPFGALASTQGLGFNYRDCAAMNNVVAAFASTGTPLDSILAAFPEGQPIDPTSWLFDQAAVTICVQNPASITITKISYL